MDSDHGTSGTSSKNAELNALFHDYTMSGEFKKRKISGIWNTFNPIDPKYAECKICNAKLSYKTSISNLKKHLQKKHPSVSMPKPINKAPTSPEDNCSFNVTVEDNSIEQKPIIRSFKKTKKALESLDTSVTIKTGKSKKVLDRKLLMMFIKDLHPYSIVEDLGFRMFVNALNPNYQLPDKHTISRTLIPTLYHETVISTKQILQNARTLCLTIDNWSSINTEMFIAVTVHFIDENFKFNSLLLDCCEMDASHTSENLAHELRIITNDWDIQDEQILLAVSNHTLNIKDALEIELQWNTLECIAHSLNLVVIEGLKLDNITEVISKLRTIIGHLKKNGVSTDDLLDYQSNSDSNPLKLIQDVPNRWNSTYYMIEQFCILKDSLKNTLVIIENDLPSLTSMDWTILEEMVLILKPFEEATKTISGEEYCSASLAIPIITGLFNVMNNLLKKHFSSNSTSFLTKLKNHLHKRLGAIEKNDTLMICTFLDPRFKTLAFSNQNAIDTVKQKIINLLVSIIQENEQSTSTAFDNFRNDDLSIWSSFHQNVTKSSFTGTSVSQAIIEVQRYLEDGIISQKENPLAWWETNKIIYPNLAMLALQYMCLLASSVPCERIFSKAGQMYVDRRSRLSRKNLKMILLLNHNFNESFVVQ